jgi:cyclophilin family peptidyl-prolyl cis-trans isomerase
MKKIFFIIFTILILSINKSHTKENKMILKLKTGEVEIELFEKIAPNHTKRIKTLADAGKYDGVVFHRVIEGFMAQTGDVKFGNSNSPEYNIELAGTGGSDLPDLKAEFSETAHNRGVLSMARSSDPNSANSQFFIVFDSAPHLDRSYSAFGKVTKGMELIDKIKRGDASSGSVDEPDKIISFRSKK